MADTNPAILIINVNGLNNNQKAKIVRLEKNNIIQHLLSTEDTL